MNSKPCDGKQTSLSEEQVDNDIIVFGHPDLVEYVNHSLLAQDKGLVAVNLESCRLVARLVAYNVDTFTILSTKEIEPQSMLTAEDIKQFLSRNSQYESSIGDHSQGLAIHIRMEKPTGRTVDCFVEFPNHSAAHQCISVHMSSQAELVKTIFPRARLVNFDNNTGQPTILQPNGNHSWS